MARVTLQDIKNAKETIKDIVKKTDILESAKLSAMTGANVFYKCENLQKTGSFKLRGACNKIANLTDEEKVNGVIASSAGNHAQGLAGHQVLPGRVQPVQLAVPHRINRVPGLPAQTEAPAPDRIR